MKNKKIFFVADAKSIHTVKWVDYFVDKEYDVHLATFSNINNTKCNNVYFLGHKETSMRGGNYHYLFSILSLANTFHKIKPDIINAHYSYSMGLIALLAKKRANIKSIFSVVCHGSDVLVPPMPYMFDKLNKYILSSADKVFVVSDQIKDKIESMKIDIDKVFVGQYGLDIKNLKKNQDKEIDILSNRAYTPNSRIEFLLDALSGLEYRNLKIIFVVPGIKEKDYEILCNKYTHIIFYKQIEYNKMVKLVSQSKIYISATQSDGTSLSLLEAMYLECIPVVSNIVSNRSWIVDGINGYLFDTKKDFLLKVNYIFSSLEYQQEIIQLNKKLVSEKADYAKQMKKIENFMHSQVKVN